MNHGHDLLGLTLAEIGFFVAFVLLLLGLADPNPTDEGRIQLLEMQLEHERQNRQASRERLRALQQMLRERQSRQRPSCIEARVADGFLAATTIVDRQLLRLVDGSVLSSGDFLDSLSEERRQADAAGCVHSVAVSYARGVDVDVYHATLRELERYFYIRRDGSQ